MQDTPDERIGRLLDQLDDPHLTEREIERIKQKLKVLESQKK